MDVTKTTKFILDSGDPNEYREIAALAKEKGRELWGATTNPTLIAKKLTGQKINSQEEAFKLQKEIVLEILTIVPGAVSAEVYADETTTAEQMVEQGREIASWNTRVYVKLPTTREGLKARSVLRREKVATNNTLVFSQQQIFAICLHEFLVQKLFGPTDNLWPMFISPFVGRLDDIQEDGMALVEHGLKLKKTFSLLLPKTNFPVWILEASVRSAEHIKRGLDDRVELITAPWKVYKAWFTLSEEEQNAVDTVNYAASLKKTPYWKPRNELYNIESIDEFFQAIDSGKLDISHHLTIKGQKRFADDWNAIIKS